MSEEDFYGDDLDYIHIKFGRMQKAYNFTDKLIKSHPNFCNEYIKYWNGEKDCKFKTPLQIARYVDIYEVPVRFYFNYTDTPVEDITEVYEYFRGSMSLYIEMASAADAERDDETDNTDNNKWRVVAVGETYEELLVDLVRSFNDEVLDSDNSWLRIVDNGKVITV